MLKDMVRKLTSQGLHSLGLKRSEPICPVCSRSSQKIGSVDFNKSCEDKEKRVFKESKRKVIYYLCDSCAHCFAPEFREWCNEDFIREIYNSEYIKVDPELTEKRPIEFAKFIDRVFGEIKKNIHHLDFGGGPGVLSNALRNLGWNSVSFDPFFATVDEHASEKFDLITAIEVFEHVPDPHQLMHQIFARMKEDGLLLFSTLPSDQVLRGGSLLKWWYLAPRNGHVSLFSTNSLIALFEKYDLKVASLMPGLFVAYRKLPGWCENIKAIAALKPM